MDGLIRQLGYASHELQLVCFPFAGGYSASFRPLQPYLQSCCDMLAIEPPGHGSNRMPLVDDFERLAELYRQALLPRLDKPFVLFGHSMGGLMVYRIAQKLEREGIYPKAMIISGIQPPNMVRKTISHMNDEALLEYIIGIGGIPPEMVQAREVMDFFLPAFRADFKALESFEHKDHTILESPVFIFNGEHDEKCMKYAFGWKKWAQRVRYYDFRGGHMYLLAETEKVASTIRSIVMDVPSRNKVFS
ncbi:thioesterase II family protein [Paenibacillus macerans]|uniref:thioesterase II family protein n=1 Tax=Paenibacillus macerans TaxID=44252 RepID=UPI003D323887